MIFCLVGTNSWDFTRLIKELDDIACDIDEEIIIQIGNNNYKPRNAKYFRYVNKNEIEIFYDRARIIVAHAGIGIIISAFKHQTPIIVVPRMKDYGEHFDNHQVDTARSLEKEGITVLWDINLLKNVLIEDIQMDLKSNKELMILKLKEYILSLEKNR